MVDPGDPMQTASTTIITVERSGNGPSGWRRKEPIPQSKFPGNFKTPGAAQTFKTAGHTKCPKRSAKLCPGSKATSTTHSWPRGGERHPTDSNFRLQASDTGSGRMTVQRGPSPTCQTVPSVNLTLPSPHPSANPRISVKTTLTASEMTARGSHSHMQRVSPPTTTMAGKQLITVR